ncbi:Hypothetical_protein [Hexamita inflata]|uniref:Hypothetical_protein n=1 Tax=Hexamita inflata TaxID=28002 RepID=A0AA86UR52_9EUKA|nr:Hypothetical protein HINF_LOCUS35193 [Hexamita inflata]
MRIQVKIVNQKIIEYMKMLIQTGFTFIWKDESSKIMKYAGSSGDLQSSYMQLVCEFSATSKNRYFSNEQKMTRFQNEVRVIQGNKDNSPLNYNINDFTFKRPIMNYRIKRGYLILSFLVLLFLRKLFLFLIFYLQLFQVFFKIGLVSYFASAIVFNSF